MHGAAIAQDRLEPILRDKAIELGADVRLNTELLSFGAMRAGVVASLRQRDGREYTLRADYLIAADGHSSPIREALGISRSGHGSMQVVRSVLFRASLDEYLASGISQFELDQPGLKGMLTTYRDGRWLLMFSDDEERDEATLRAKVVQAVGRPDLEFELITTGRWVLSALIADRFSSGRVFLVGDAAHTLPPARGGYGANTGIEDSFNLAWKLAAVLSGASSPELLDTYDAERRPIAWLRHDQIFARRDYARWATAEESGGDHRRRCDGARPTLPVEGRAGRGRGAAACACAPSNGRVSPERAPRTSGSRRTAPSSRRSTSCSATGLSCLGSERWCEAAQRAARQLDLRVHTFHVNGHLCGADTPIPRRHRRKDPQAGHAD